MTSLRAALCAVLLSSSAVAAQPAALDEYLRMRPSIEAAADGAGRAELEQRVAAARRRLLDAARRSSRLVVMTERRGDFQTSPAVETARLVARDGRVTLQALGGARARSPEWERAGTVEPGAYATLLDRVLRDPALVGDWPAPRFDPNAPGPRRAVVVRLAIENGEREMQALDGSPYERLAGLAAAVLEFCRSVPLGPAP